MSTHARAPAAPGLLAAYAGRAARAAPAAEEGPPRTKGVPPEADREGLETAPPPDMPRVARAAPTARRVGRGLSAAVLGAGLLTLLAWLLPTGSGAFLAPYEMKVNTAIGLACAGGANWLYLGAPSPPSMQRVARALALIVAGVGLLTFLQYAFGWDLSIDQLLAPEHPALLHQTAHPGRMGSNTALGLFLTGGAMALRDHPSASARRGVEAAAVLAGVIALLAVIGHVFGVQTFYAVAQHTQMAPQTAVALFALCAAVLLAHPERGLVALVTSDGSGGFMARRLIPLIVAVPMVTGWLSISGVRARLYDAEFGASVDVVLAILVLSAVVLLSARTLNQMDEERRRSEESILELNRRLTQHAHELEEVNRELESFSYSVSHDLRSPIRHIGGFAELLEKRSAHALDEKGRHYVETICESARRAGVLIDDLLAFSRMSRAEMTMGRVDMERCVADVWRELAPDRAGRAVDFRAGPLPAVTGDAAMLRLVVQNLLSNALKYTRPREKAVIEVGARADRGEVVFSVRDDGVGFDMRYVDKLFGVFQRLHGPKAFEGVGIGLANVKRIVQRHGGRVWAEGAVDRGATFFFALPEGGTR